MIIALFVVAILLLTCASGACSSAEVAFFSLPSSRVKQFRSDPHPRKQQVARLLAQPKSLLVTIFLCNTIANVLLQNFSSDLFGRIGAGTFAKVGVPTILVLFFGELMPKYFGLIHNITLSLLAAPTLEAIQHSTKPLRTILVTLTTFFSRVIFFFLKPSAPLSKEEIRHLLASSESQGYIHRDESEMILALLDLEEMSAKEIMVHRQAMPSYHIDEPLSKLAHLFSETALQEIPVFQRPDEKLLGIISAKTFLVERPRIKRSQDLVPILQSPFFIPENTSARILLRSMRRLQEPLALIIDEYGMVSGMVYQEDLMTSLCRHLAPPKTIQPEYTPIGSRAIIAEGTMPIEAVRKRFGVTLKSAYHAITLGGYLTEKLGCIPQNGASWQEEGLFFRILERDSVRIRKVYVQPLSGGGKG